MPPVYLYITARRNYVNLAEEQAKMRARWKSRRRVNRDGEIRLIPSAYAEKNEIDLLAERKDLKCPVCKVSIVKVDRSTGELKTCKKCQARNEHLRKTYGLTRHQYDKMLFQQKNRCAICVQPFTDDIKPCVEHCHDLKHVRGLTCSACNSLIGNAKEDETILMNAAKYIRNNRIERTWWATSVF